MSWRGKRGGREHWLNRDYGGMPGWGFVIVGLIAVGVLGLWAYKSTQEPEAVAWSPQPQASETPTPNPEPTVAVFLGDSYTEGTGADTPAQGFAPLTAEAMGWEPVVLGEGATGYIADGPVEFPERSAIPDRVAHVVELAPDVVVVAAGMNDSSLDLTPGQVQTAAEQTFADLTSGLPDSTVYVVGPFWPNGHPVAEVLEVRDEIQAAADKYGLTFIDPIAGEWITGLQDKSDGGNNVEYIGDDGTHPTNEGHAYLAQRLVEALSTS